MRRSTILGCTRELILARGVENVRMEDIAEKSELSKATLYLHFPSKEAIFGDICDESARDFFEYLKTIPASGHSGMQAIRFLWQGYVKLFGSSNEMLIAFRIRSYLDSWPADDRRKVESPHIGAIFAALHAMVEQCKADGIFDSGLDSAKAVQMMLLLFSDIIRDASSLPLGERNSPAIVGEMTKTFQILIRGFASEGTEHSLLDITIPEGS